MRVCAKKMFTKVIFVTFCVFAYIYLYSISHKRKNHLFPLPHQKLHSMMKKWHKVEIFWKKEEKSKNYDANKQKMTLK
jgi:hypothetical protein